MYSHYSGTFSELLHAFTPMLMNYARFDSQKAVDFMIQFWVLDLLV